MSYLKISLAVILFSLLGSPAHSQTLEKDLLKFLNSRFTTVEEQQAAAKEISQQIAEADQIHDPLLLLKFEEIFEHKKIQSALEAREAKENLSVLFTTTHFTFQDNYVAQGTNQFREGMRFKAGEHFATVIFGMSLSAALNQAPILALILGVIGLKYGILPMHRRVKAFKEERKNLELEFAETDKFLTNLRIRLCAEIEEKRLVPQ
jgi:hypothetical protein